MLCDRCKRRQASMHVQFNDNGRTIEQHFCEVCAAETGAAFGSGLSVGDFLSSLFQIVQQEQAQSAKVSTCPDCHMTWDDFQRIGKFGCASCYDTFQEQIQPLARRLHGNILHTGRVPQGQKRRISVRQEIENLKTQLSEAVTREAYEQAAALRDRIRQLEGENL